MMSSAQNNSDHHSNYSDAYTSRTFGGGGKGRVLSSDDGRSKPGFSNSPMAYFRAICWATLGCILITMYHIDCSFSALPLPSFTDLHGSASGDAADDDGNGSTFEDDGAEGEASPTWPELWHHTTEVSPFFEDVGDGDVTDNKDAGFDNQFLPSFSDLRGNAMGDVDTPLDELTK